MAELVKNLNEMSSTRVCIDTYDRGVVTGKLYNIYLTQPYEFNSMVMLLSAMNELYDVCGYPKANMQQRYFGEKPEPIITPLIDTENISIQQIMVTESSAVRGRIATFRIKVMFRQNASWQGSIIWIEEKREENFRSALELIMIMDGALCSIC